MAVAAKYTELLKNIKWGQASSFFGSLAIAASMDLVAYELKQSRDIAEIDLAIQRLEIFNKAWGTYDLERSSFTMKALADMSKLGMEHVEPEQVLAVNNRIFGVWDVFELSYITHTHGLMSEPQWEANIKNLVWILCDDEVGTLHMSVIDGQARDPAFVAIIKNAYAETDCSQLDPLPNVFK